jgi:hypothetical protein
MAPDFGKCEQAGGISGGGGSITMSSITGNVGGNVVGKADYHCDQGYYLPLVLCPECKGCPAGQYYTSNASAVETCPVISASGYQPPPVACIPCPAGKFQDQSAQPSCIDCPAGKFGSVQGSSSSGCSGACPSGTDCSAGGCAAATPLIPGRHYTASSGAGTCQFDEHTCSAGSFCSEGVESPCSDGSFSSTVGAAFCLTHAACSAGQHVVIAGTSTFDRSCNNCSRACRTRLLAPRARTASTSFSRASRSAQSKSSACRGSTTVTAPATRRIAACSARQGSTLERATR